MCVCVCTWHIAGAYREPHRQSAYGSGGSYGGESGIGALDGDRLAGVAEPGRSQAVCGGDSERFVYWDVFVIWQSDVAAERTGETETGQWRR